MSLKNRQTLDQLGDIYRYVIGHCIWWKNQYSCLKSKLMLNCLSGFQEQVSLWQDAGQDTLSLET